MADISLAASHEYWSGFQDEVVYRVIVLLETIERNYYDGQADYEQSMSRLGDALSLMRPGDDIKEREALLDVLAYTKTSRYLKFYKH